MTFSGLKWTPLNQSIEELEQVIEQLELDCQHFSVSFEINPEKLKSIKEARLFFATTHRNGF